MKANQWTPLADRIWPRIEMTETCWLWTGPLWRSGYGRVMLRGKATRAHRVVWELLHGPIANGLHVLHSCDNKQCVRPDHLRLGTHQDNMRDAKERHRFPGLGGVTPETAARGDRHGTHTHPETVTRGTDHHNSKLTEVQVADIRRRYTGAHGQLSQLAREFGVSHTNIRTIVLGKGWAHLPVVKPEPVAPANGECQFRIGQRYRCRRPWTAKTDSGWFCALHG